MRGTLLETFLDRAATAPGREALRELAAGGAPSDRSLTWRDWADHSRGFAAALVAAGVPPTARVAVLGGNTALWPIADLGVQLARCVSVGIYPGSSETQLRVLLEDSGASLLVVDSSDQLTKALAVRESLPALRIIAHGAVSIPEGVDGWSAWLRRGRTLLAEDAATAAALERRTTAVEADDDAVLVYTSGSSGVPKGARLSHRCLLASAESIRQTLELTDADSSLSFLPFSHSAERVFGLATRIHCGMSAGLVVDHARIWDAARDFEPTVIGGVPRFFEKLHQGWVVAQAAGTPAIEWRRAWVGSKLRFVTSGGAAMADATAAALDAAGVRVLGAYGLTEHLCVAFNRPDDPRYDSAGPPMPGTELRIAEHGELLVRRGVLTFSGYHGKDAETADAFTEDGEWLRTGDLGEIDAEGRLRITGRLKELIALAAGKKVAPVPLEQRLQSSEWISQAVCLGEGRRFLVALIALDRTAVERWAAGAGLRGDFGALIAHDQVRAQVQQLVDALNDTLSPPERIRRFHILDHELSVESGELTPTLKLRRGMIAERFAHQVEALYQ